MEILIWNIRNSKHMSIRELADKSGLKKSTLYNYENNKTSPTLHQLEKIAKALDVKISDLYKE